MSTTTEFDEYAPQYDDLVRSPIRDKFSTDSVFFAERKWQLLQQYLSRRGLDSHDMAWLDVGCGTGTLLRLAGEAFQSAAGCDPSSEMLETCEDLQISVQTESTRLPFDADQFDLVTLVCVLHHVVPGERRALMQDVGRVLRPGGLVCIFEHNPLNPVTRLVVSQTPVDRDAVLLSSGEARRLLGDAGCVPSRVEYFLYLPESLYRRAGRIERLATRVPLGGQYAAIGTYDVG